MIFRDPFCSQFQIPASYQASFCGMEHKNPTTKILWKQRDSAVDSLSAQKTLITCQLYHCCLLSYHLIFLSLSSHVGKMVEMYTSQRSLSFTAYKLLSDTWKESAI